MELSSTSRYDQLPQRVRTERDGQNAVERLAIAVVRREIAALPASLVVQLALWPDEIASWAREARLAESLVYNTLAARKPYARTRALIAERLGVGIGVVDHLIESPRALPTVRQGAEAVLASGLATDVPRAAPVAREPIDWSRPPYPRWRDGTNPVERRAVRAVEIDVASMPAATVVGLAIWPETLAAWSRAERLKSSVVWATLAGSPSVPVRDALARRLGVSLRELDALVSLERAVPVAKRPVAALTPTVAIPVTPAAPPPETAPTAPPAVPRTPRGPAPAADQLGFDL
jgi:hypothetical protein